MVLKIQKYFPALILELILISCDTQKRYVNYKESVATITSFGEPSGLFPLSHNNVTWANYMFSVKRKVTQYDPDDDLCYDFKIYGRENACSHSEIGEKFVVKYDAKVYDNFHSFLVLCKPLFLDDEKTITTKGTIVTTYGKDRLREGMIAILFQYNIPTLNQTGDTVQTSFIKYQYLVPKLNIDTIKADIKTGKKFKVLYNVENPKRAIIYYNQN